MDISEVIEKAIPILKILGRGDSRELQTLENALKTIKYQSKIDRIDCLIAQRNMRPEGLEEARERLEQLHHLMDVDELVHPEVERLEVTLGLIQERK